MLRYTKTAEGEQLAEEVALARAMSMLKMELWTKAVFVVKDKTAYFSGRVTPTDNMIGE
ncbi:hypothetical protein D3C87_1653290 [compost metagenome]